MLRKISNKVWLPDCMGKMVSFASTHCVFWMHNLQQCRNTDSSP